MELIDNPMFFTVLTSNRHKFLVRKSQENFETSKSILLKQYFRFMRFSEWLEHSKSSIYRYIGRYPFLNTYCGFQKNCLHIYIYIWRRFFWNPDLRWKNGIGLYKVIYGWVRLLRSLWKHHKSKVRLQENRFWCS